MRKAHNEIAKIETDMKIQNMNKPIKTQITLSITHIGAQFYTFQNMSLY